MATRALTVALLALAPCDAKAEPGATSTEATPAPSAVRDTTPIHARVALSRAADAKLTERRLRRLLSIELGRRAVLDPETTGPLGDDLVQVWVDADGERILLHVRRSGRTLARRSVDVVGYPPDIAARMVALEASEMIRVQAGLAASDPCASCRAPAKATPSELASLAVLASMAGRVTPLADARWLAGPRLEVGHQHGPIRQTLHGEWFVGRDGGTNARWAALGLGIDGRLPLGSSASPWKLAIGLHANVASLRQTGAVPMDNWTAAVGARVAAEVAVGRRAWLGLALEPGVVVRPVEDHLSGFTLGAALTFAAGPTR